MNRIQAIGDVIQVTADNRERVKAFYLSLCDQGRANFLYENMIGGATLGLSPEQYPKVSPFHRRCSCGSEPVLVGSMVAAKGDIFIRCPNCGCKSVSERSPVWAWRAWDARKLATDDSNITLWEVLENEKYY